MQRRLVPGGTCPPPGGLEACCAWRLVCNVRWYWWSKGALLMKQGFARKWGVFISQKRLFILSFASSLFIYFLKTTTRWASYTQFVGEWLELDWACNFIPLYLILYWSNQLYQYLLLLITLIIKFCWYFFDISTYLQKY